MKTLHLSIIMIFIISSTVGIGTVYAYGSDGGYLITSPPAYPNSTQSENTNEVEIQNIQVQPSVITIGGKFSISATLVNNSTNPIDVETNDCTGILSMVFDNHVRVEPKERACTYMLLLHMMNPGEKFTGINPPSGVTYTANATGTTNATVAFSYNIKNQTDPNSSNIEKTISKSFLFTIYGNNVVLKTVNETPLPPLEQFKSGISPLNVKCTTNYVLVIKAEDGSPACVKWNDTANLMNKGWAINQFIVGINYRNQGISVIESDLGYIKNENGTFSQTVGIYVFINNFTQSSYPIKVQVLHDDIPSRTDIIPSTDILSDGFYKYQFTQQGAIFGGYKIIATYGNKTSQTSFENPIPP